MSKDIEIGKQKAELCASNASAQWNTEAYKAFVMFAKKQKNFTTGDVRRWLQEKKQLFPHDNRAWGGVATLAKRNRIISRTGKFAYSGSHGRPDAIWKSEILK